MHLLKYSIRNGIKSIVKNSSPVFGIGYKYSGIIDGPQEYDYSYVFGSLKYGDNFGVGNRFDMFISGGKIFRQSNLDFPEFLHFKGNQTILITGDLFNSYRILPYYYYSTNDYYFMANGYYQFRKLLLTQILYTRLAGLREDIYFNYLYSNTIQNYYEIGYAVDNIFRLLRLEVVGQFIGSKYEGIGFRIGISKNISLE
jgi:hypothetical protein